MEASALSHPVGLGRLSVAGPLLRLRSDEQLVALFRAGHDEAFGAIHDRYRPRLFAYARQMLSGSPSDAEDVLQDVFLRAYHALRQDRRPVTLRAWLYRVAHNRCIDHLRRPVPAPADVYDVNRGPQQDPIAAAERREDLRRLVQDVQRLPEQQRSALLMREMEGLTYSELADALGVTVPAVKSLLVRARIGLVEAIEARDTACTEIRTDLAAAFDRGVRASGRARRHMRECAGCREYRGALRGLEKRLNGLSPGAGPLATLAKVLGIGGSGAGAAAGSGVAAAGGGGAAAGGVSAVTLGTGAVAGATSKVVAVVAAAAVVGGGAATVEEVRSLQPSAPPAHRTVRAVAVRPAMAPSPAAVALRDPRLRLAHGALRPVRGSHRATAPSVARLDAGGPVGASSGDQSPPAYEPTTGGLQAPDAPALAEPPGTATPAPGTPAALWGAPGSGPSPSPGGPGTAGNAAGASAATSSGTAVAAGDSGSGGAAGGPGTASGAASSGSTGSAGTGSSGSAGTGSSGSAVTGSSGSAGTRSSEGAAGSAAARPGGQLSREARASGAAPE